MAQIEGFRAHVDAIKTSRWARALSVPIDVTDLVDVDMVLGEAITTRVTIAELLARKPTLEDLSPDEEGVELSYRFGYTRVDRNLEAATDYEEAAAYSADPDGIGRFGWRKPGMHKRRVPKDGSVLWHGNGKRKKGKRK